MNDLCPICSSEHVKRALSPTASDAFEYNCQKCGSFLLDGSLEACLPSVLAKDADSAAKLSHAIRRAQERDASPLRLDTYAADAILLQPLPRPKEQADLLLRWLANNTAGPGEKIRIEFETHGSIIGSKSRAGFELVINHLFDKHLVTGVQSKTLGGGDQADATLSFDGWDYYEALREGGVVYRKAFMAMKFGSDDLKRVLDDVFKPSAKRAGFDLFKLDDLPRAGLIDDRLRVEIQSSDFLIADLTYGNLGAYWEAGYAEGLGKPVIYTCEKSWFESENTHFDTNHHLTIFWDKTTHFLAGGDLTATIRATLPHIAKMTDNP